MVFLLDDTRTGVAERSSAHAVDSALSSTGKTMGEADDAEVDDGSCCGSSCGTVVEGCDGCGVVVVDG